MPTYQEANPTVITIVTFPFLFGMMFGDVGHGSLILILGLVLTFGNNYFKGGLLNDVLQLRYFVLLLGFASIYCGFVYNEFFAIPMNLFPSCYEINDREIWGASLTEDHEVDGEYTYLRTGFQCNYPVGIDPIWGLSKNRLSFSNNVKMKLSVIIGVVHMMIGIIIKGTNSVYFSRWATLFTEVIAGSLIFLGLFGWMDLLIFGKWIRPLDIEDKTLVNQ